MRFWNEISDRLAGLTGSATPEQTRAALNEFDVRDIQAVRVSENTGGVGGNVPFVGVDPPPDPTDGMLWWDPDDNTPSASQTGALTLHTLIFQESAGAGTYTATLALPTDAIICDVLALPIGAPWDADTAELNVGDESLADVFLDALDLTINGALQPAYTKASPQGLSFNTGSGTGTYPDTQTWVQVAGQLGVYYDADDTLTATAVTTGAGGTTGLLRVQVLGFGITGGTTNAVKS